MKIKALNFQIIIPIILCLLLGISTNISAQNLVLNYSFENTSSCPNGISELFKATNWHSTNTGADSCSSPDLYAGCSWAIGGANSPDALLGFQRSKTGTKHAGIILYEALSPYREYLGGELSSTLQSGQVYCVKFYVSVADEGLYATNSIGIHFSSTPLQKNFCLDNSAPHPVTPQLQYSGPVIRDSVNWVPLEWSYTATGNERYFTIGNFNNNSNTNAVSNRSGFSVHPYAYYFVEDVEVTPDFCCPEVDILSTTPVSCNGQNDGSASVTVSGGLPPYSYAWSAGSSNTATNTNLPAGRHTVTVSDARGCQVPKYIDILEPATLSVAIIENSNSCGTSLTASSTGGTAPFSYLWSNGATAASISNAPIGSYTVTITDNGNCTATANTTVSQNSAFSVNTTATDNGSCSACNGTATATPVGGTAPFSYLWSNGDTTATINDLCAGTYTVTVSEATGSSGSVFWNENFTNGGTGWTLNIAGPGANGADANQWVVNSNVNECSNCPSTGSAGNYLHITCTSTPCQLGGDVGTCVYEHGVPIFADAATDKYVSSPNISTLGQSGITLSFWYMSGGESGNDYGLVRLSDDGGATWTDLPAQYEGVQTCTQANISIPATYENIADFRIGFRWINDNNTDGIDPPFMIDDIELSSATGSACNAISTVTISNTGAGLTANIDSSSNISCAGANDGYISANVSGSGSYNYSWSNGETTSSISGLSAGTYTVTIDDGNNCTTTLSATISSPSALSMSENISGSGCDGNAVITVNVAGGTPNYTYSWSNGANSNSISGLISGTYSLTVSDANGCSINDSYSIPNNGNFNVSLSPTDASCQGPDGSITSNVSGANLPLSYEWSNGAQSADLQNIANGTYTLTVTDGNNCTVSATSTVNISGSGLNAVIDSTSDISCAGANDGFISVNVSGTGTYNYTWSNGGTGANISGLSAGTYTVTIDDGSNCNSTLSATLNSPTALSISENVSGSGCDANAVITVNVSGGTPNYSYIWSNGDNSNSTTGLSSGTYNLTVTDANGCIANSSYSIPNNGSFTISFTSTNTTCQGIENGSLTSSVSGANLPLTYAWSNGETTDALQNIAGGIYWLTVTDANNCTVSASDTVFESNSISAIAGISDVVCPENKEGGIKLIPIDGAEPYTALWSDGSTSIGLAGVSAGDYSVTVTDSVGCQFDTTYTISSLSNFTISATSTSLACGENVGGSATVKILSGNTAPYSYLWSNGEETANISDLAAGVYTLTVSDSLNCKKLDTVEVFASALNIKEEIVNASCPDEADASISVSVTGGTKPYEFLWNNGETDSILQNLLAGTYTLSVNDAANCSQTKSFQLLVDERNSGNCDSLLIYDVFSPNGDGKNDLWVIDGIQDYPNNDLQIFNRWGEKVFEANPYTNNWDGRNKNGKDLATATYYYILKLNDASDKVYSGHINLIR